MTEKTKQAIQRFCNGHSCAQSILTSYADKYQLNIEQAMKLTTGLAGGMGRMGNTCGTITGSILVLGLEHNSGKTNDNESKEKTMSAVQTFSKKFAEKHGSLLCRELLECNISDPEGYQRARSEQLFKKRCPNYVETAVEILEDMMQKQQRARSNEG